MTSWGTRRCPEKLSQSWHMRKKQVVDSTICSKSWPVVCFQLGSPAAKVFCRQFRKKCASIKIRHNDKYKWFKLSFIVPIDRENPDHTLCSVLLECRWILISFEDRQIIARPRVSQQLEKAISMDQALTHNLLNITNYLTPSGRILPNYNIFP